MTNNNITKALAEPHTFCRFCYEVCMPLADNYILQRTTYKCTSCQYTYYRMFWGSKEPHAYLVSVGYNDWRYDFEVELTHKWWRFMWEGIETLGRGDFNETPPDITPANFLKKLPLMLIVS